MSLEWIRARCMALPHVTEQVQWESLVFKVGGKMFALAPVEPGKFCLSLKVEPKEFDELVETPGIAQAPYAAKRMWFAMESLSALPKAEVERRIRASYDLVFAKLTKKAQAELSRAVKGKKK